MAEFSVNVVTTAGLALIARATAASQLIYTRVLSDADAMTAAAAALATPADFSGPEGTILAASATDTTARVVGRIGNQATATSVKTFALCGKIDGDASDVVVAVLSDADASIPIPDTSSPVTGVEVGFLLDITSADTVTVQVTGAGSVTFGDIERFVSCHKAGDPTTGEAQAILGDKTFSGGCTFEQGATFSDEVGGTSMVLSSQLEVSDGIQCDGTLGIGGTATFGYEIALSGPTVPDGEECYFNALQSIDGATTTDSLILSWPDHVADETLIDLQSDKVKVGGDLEARSLYVETSVYIYATLTVDGDASFNGNATFDLGLTSNDVITSLSTIVVKDDSVRVFASSDRLKAELSASGLNVSNSSGVTTGVLNADTGNLSISGTASVGGISGVAPYRDSSNNLVIPVGAPVLAYIPKQSGASVSKKVGEIVQPSDFNPQPQTGYIRDDGNSSTGGAPDQMGTYDNENIPAGKYACLNSVQVSGANGALVWLKRVPD